MPILILGGSGLVGSRLHELWSADTDVISPSHAELDVLDPAALETFLRATHANRVVNLAAWADVDGAERESGDTGGVVHRLNVDFPAQLARVCRSIGKHLVHVSTDYVFDGTNADRAYVEDDPTRPLGWYADTKRRGELAVLQADDRACIARIEMPYTGAQAPKRDLARLVAGRLQQGQMVQGVTNQRITPVFLDDASAALRKLADARFSGLVHVAASTWTTPYELVRGIARRLQLSEDLIQPVEFADFAASRPARRPQHSWLDVSRFTTAFGGGVLRPVEEALDLWTRQWSSVS